MPCPKQYCFFIRGNDFISFYKKFSEQGFLKNLLSNKTINRINHQVLRLDSLANLDKNIADYLKNNEIIISVHKTSSSRVDALLLLQTNRAFNADAVGKLVKTKEKFLFVKRDFKNATIYDYQLTPQKSLLAYSICNGILIMSENALLVEDAISTLDQNGNKEIPLTGFTRAVKNENLFLNFSQFNSILEMFLTPENKSIADGLKYFAGFGKYECEFQKDFIYLRGNLSAKDSLNDFVSFFSGQKPKATDIQKVISDRTAVLLSFHPEDFLAYYKKYTARLKNSNKLVLYQADVKMFEQKYNLNLVQDIIPLLEGQFSLVINEPVTDNLSNCSVAIIKVNDTEKAINVFDEFDKDAFADDSTGKGFKSDYRDYKIYRSNVVESLPLLFGKAFKMFNQAYFVNIRDYLVFSPNYTNLKRFIDDYVNEKTLSTSTEFNKFSEKFISETNFLFYLNPMKSMSIPENFSDTSFLNKLHKNVDYFNNFNFFIFDIANNNNSFYSEIIANYTAKAQESKENLWSLELEGNLEGNPVAVKSGTGNAAEILLCDNASNIYNISSSGMINWKRKLNSQAVGTISPVDLFSNGKTQFLCVTQSEIYIIDRLGKNAGSYPVKPGNQAITGPCVIPEKDNIPLKYFIGAENATVYGFEKTGKALNGWNPKKIRGNLAMPLKSFSKGW